MSIFFEKNVKFLQFFDIQMAIFRRVRSKCNIYALCPPVGAGSAGSVLAARLSEERDVTVLLLEAGYDDRHNLLFQAPLLGQSVFHTGWVWEEFTQEHPHMDSMRDKVRLDL